jgi:hypothetical protein
MRFNSRRAVALGAGALAVALAASVDHLGAVTHTTSVVETSDIGPGQANRQATITLSVAEDSLAWAWTMRLSASQGWWTPPVFEDDEALASQFTFEFRDETDAGFVPVKVRLITQDGAVGARDSIEVYLTGILPWTQVPDSAVGLSKRAIEIVRFANTNPDTVAIIRGRKIR